MVTKKQAYTIEENGLMSFIEKRLGSHEDPPEIRKLLAKYRKQRVMSALFQDARNGVVSAETVKRALQERYVDARLLFILLGYFLPNLTREMIGKHIG